MVKQLCNSTIINVIEEKENNVIAIKISLLDYLNWMTIIKTKKLLLSMFVL